TTSDALAAMGDAMDIGVAGRFGGRRRRGLAATTVGLVLAGIDGLDGKAGIAVTPAAASAILGLGKAGRSEAGGDG
ncbi:hypothetical protein, partial [Stenotrophomonas maltophilia]|uniref:hypothetical protein n=1 Tax=Stenotrophomonas maltophilia TaxID=40324 RepID=UPI0013DC078B